MLGTTERSSVLVLPAEWLGGQEEGLSRDFQIYHELAHLRNRDLAFTTWAYALVRTLGVSLLVMLVIMAIAVALGQIPLHKLITTASPFALGFGVVWILYHLVLREREFDADARAAAVSDSDPEAVVRAIETTDPILHPMGRGDEGADWQWRLQMWSADKLAFGRPRLLWRTLVGIIAYVSRTHPSIVERQGRILRPLRAQAWETPSAEYGIWTGLVTGIFIQGLLLVVGTLLLSLQVVPGARQEYLAKEVALPFWQMCCVLVIPMGVAFVALLPSRFSDERRPMPLAYPLRMAGWFLFVTAGLFGAVLTMAPIFWELAYVGFGAIIVSYMVAIGVAALCSALRGVGGPLKIVPFVPIIVIELAAYALAFLPHSLVPGIFLPIIGGMLICSTLFSGRPESRSWDDGFCVLRAFGREWRVEGPRFRRLCNFGGSGPFFMTFVIPGWTVGLVAGVLYCLLRGQSIHRPLSDVEWAVWLGALVLIMILGLSRVAMHMGGLLPERLKSISLCSDILRKPDPSFIPRYQDALSRVANALTQDGEWLDYIPVKVPEMQLYLISCAQALGRAEALMPKVIQNVLRNECAPGGFGPWPGAAPTLASTYYSLATLARLGRLDAVNAEKHLAWILNLRQPDGSFADPLLRYPIWKQTWWGLACIRWLGGDAKSSLSPAFQDELRTGLSQALARGMLTEEMSKSLWCLKTTGSVLQRIGEQVADLCRRRAPRLLEMRATWVVGEYSALVELMEMSEVVSHRVNLDMKKLVPHLEEALSGLCCAYNLPISVTS
jgi:hypothetical protein